MLCWDDASVSAALVPGPALPVSSLSTVTRQALCRLLDPAHPAGTDWCMLAVSLGLSDKVGGDIYTIYNIYTIYTIYGVCTGPRGVVMLSGPAHIPYSGQNR